MTRSERQRGQERDGRREALARRDAAEGERGALKGGAAGSAADQRVDQRPELLHQPRAEAGVLVPRGGGH